MKALCNSRMHIEKPRTHHSMVSRVSRNVHNDAYSFSAVICTLACRVGGRCLAKEPLQLSCRVAPTRAYLKHRAMCMDASAFRQSFQDHRKVTCSSTAALQQCSTHSMEPVVLDTLLGEGAHRHSLSQFWSSSPWEKESQYVLAPYVCCITQCS